MMPVLFHVTWTVSVVNVAVCLLGFGAIGRPCPVVSLTMQMVATDFLGVVSVRGPSDEKERLELATGSLEAPEWPSFDS